MYEARKFHEHSYVFFVVLKPGDKEKNFQITCDLIRGLELYALYSGHNTI